MSLIKHMKGNGQSEKDWHWAYNVIILGLFVGVFSIAFVMQKTFITRMELSKVLAFCCFGWFIVPLKFYKQWLGLNKLAIFLLGVVGFGPIIVSAMLWANLLFIKETRTEQFIVQKIVPESYNVSGIGLTSVLYEYSNSSLVEYPEFRRFEFTGDKSILLTKKVNYTFGKGLFGYDVIENRELVFE